MPINQVSTISVDIGHSNLKIIQIAPDGKINKFVVHKMPEGCVDDLNIFSEDALVHSLKTARKKAKMRKGKCYLVLSGSDIIIRQFTLPMLEEKQLYQNILHEISGYLPVDPEKYYVDYKIAGIINEDGIDMYKLIVTTAHRRTIDKYKKALRAAGFRVKIIDTCENSKEKLLRYNHSKDDSFPISGGICILDLGTKYTRVNLYYNGYYYVSNIIKRSSQSITEVISQYSGKDILVSEMIKRETDFLNSAHPNEEIKSAVTYEVDSLLYEISRVFDYYKNRTKSVINTIYIAGGGSLLPGLKEYIEKHIGIPVRFAADLVLATNANNKVDAKGFSFLLNAYSATFREDQK
ncbi:MAG: pilus assembly protein PilM [Christensenellales bacterium]|jgi:type IV pilus assembly protein PilM